MKKRKFGFNVKIDCTECKTHTHIFMIVMMRVGKDRQTFCANFRREREQQQQKRQFQSRI